MKEAPGYPEDAGVGAFIQGLEHLSGYLSVLQSTNYLGQKKTSKEKFYQQDLVLQIGGATVKC